MTAQDLNTLPCANFLGTEADILKDIEVIKKFSDQLFSYILLKKEGNIAISGLNTFLELSMCVFGAADDMKQELFEKLSISNSESMKKSIYKIISFYKETPNFDVTLCTRIYHDRELILTDNFKDDTKVTYGSDIVSIDNNVSLTVKNINDWISSCTDKKIEHLVSIDDFTSTNKLLIVSAAFFSAQWYASFQRRLTSAQPFHINKIDKVNVWMMECTEDVKYLDLPQLNAECVAKPYKNKDFLLVVIKPRDIDGLKRLEKEVGKFVIDYYKLEDSKYSLCLPKFQIETMLDMSEYADYLKLSDLFIETVDVGEEAESPKVVKVDNIIQKISITVDESGTKPATIKYGPLPSQSNKLKFFVDRPFIFSIINLKFNLTLFSGRVVYPESSNESC